MSESSPYQDNERTCSHPRVTAVTGVCLACGEVSERYLDWYERFGRPDENEQDVAPGSAGSTAATS